MTATSAPTLRAFSYWMLQYRRVWRGTFVISVLNPMLFLIGIGAGLGKLVDQHAPAQIAGVPYVAFFAPGLLAAASMQTGFLESAGSVWRAANWEGAYRGAVTTPLDPEQIMYGHLLFITFRLVTSSAAFLAVMSLFGAARSWWTIAVLPAAVLTGLAFAVPMAAWSVTVTRSQQINSVFRFFIMPLYMFSGTFFAITQLPEWIRWVAYVLPLYHGVELCRTLALGTATLGGSAVHIGYLVVLSLVGLLLARRNYRRVLHT
jgi:lipooligosaccharide transport system permease protein